MADDTASDLDTVMRHLQSEFGRGRAWISRMDVLPDGRRLDETVTSAMNGPLDYDEGSGEVAALHSMAEMWGHGFDRVDADYIVASETTLVDVARDYRFQDPGPSIGPR